MQLDLPPAPAPPQGLTLLIDWLSPFPFQEFLTIISAQLAFPRIMSFPRCSIHQPIVVSKLFKGNMPAGEKQLSLWQEENMQSTNTRAEEICQSLRYISSLSISY